MSLVATEVMSPHKRKTPRGIRRKATQAKRSLSIRKKERRWFRDMKRDGGLRWIRTINQCLKRALLYH